MHVVAHSWEFDMIRWVCNRLVDDLPRSIDALAEFSTEANVVDLRCVSTCVPIEEERNLCYCGIASGRQRVFNGLCGVYQVQILRRFLGFRSVKVYVWDVRELDSGSQ